MNRIAAMAEILLPIALAVALLGQIIYLAAYYYLGIGHIGKVAWGTMLASLAFLLWHRRKDWHFLPIDYLVLLLGILAMLSCYWIGKSNLLQSFYYLILYGIACYLSGRSLTERQQVIFLRTATVLGAISFLLCYINFLALPPYYRAVDRVPLFSVLIGTSVLRDAVSIYGAFTFGTALVVLYALLLLHPPQFHRKIFFWAAAILLLATLCWLELRIASRSSAIAVGISILVLTMCARWQKLLPRLWLLGLFISLLTLAVFTQPEERINMLNQIMSPYAQNQGFFKFDPHLVKNWDRLSPEHREFLLLLKKQHCLVAGNSVATRYALMESAVELTQENPFTGIGAGNFGYSKCISDTNFASPHNLTMHYFVELGIVGGLLYLGIIAYLLWHFARLLTNPNAPPQILTWLVAAAWLYVLIYEQANGNYFLDFHYHAFTGLAAGAVAISKQRERGKAS